MEFVQYNINELRNSSSWNYQSLFSIKFKIPYMDAWQMVENAYVMVLIRLWLTFLIKKYSCGLHFLQNTHTHAHTDTYINRFYIPATGEKSFYSYQWDLYSISTGD